MDSIARLEEWVAVRRDELLKEWADWIRQPSVSSDGTGFPAAASYGAELVRRCGLSADIAETPGRPVILAVRKAYRSRRTC